MVMDVAVLVGAAGAVPDSPLMVPAGSVAIEDADPKAEWVPRRGG